MKKTASKTRPALKDIDLRITKVSGGQLVPPPPSVNWTRTNYGGNVFGGPIGPLGADTRGCD